MTDESKALEAAREALRDMFSGWNYIRHRYGDLGGVGWEQCTDKTLDALAAIEAALAAPEPSPPVPEGWRLVPIEPTDEMIWQGGSALHDRGENTEGIYAAMLSTAPASSSTSEAVKSFQERVAPWMQACFGPETAADRVERNDRFLEEALELVQSLGMPIENVLRLVGYVYGRPAGEPHQEVGGVMITLAALCLSHGLDMHRAGDDELARISTPAMIEKIRAKQASKPKGALPAHVEGNVLAPVHAALSRLSRGSRK